MVREITVKTGKEHTAKYFYKFSGYKAWDEVEKIGEATHERFIIKPKKLISRLAKKKAK
jgi:predicted thioesterase